MRVAKVGNSGRWKLIGPNRRGEVPDRRGCGPRASPAVITKIAAMERWPHQISKGLRRIFCLADSWVGTADFGPHGWACQTTTPAVICYATEARLARAGHRRSHAGPCGRIAA